MKTQFTEQSERKLLSEFDPALIFKMYYVYLLRDEKTSELYYGYTNDLNQRIKKHNAKYKCKLIYYEAYVSESDARERERKLKYYGQTRTCLKKRLRESLRA